MLLYCFAFWSFLQMLQNQTSINQIVAGTSYLFTLLRCATAAATRIADNRMKRLQSAHNTARLVYWQQHDVATTSRQFYAASAGIRYSSESRSTPLSLRGEVFSALLLRIYRNSSSSRKYPTSSIVVNINRWADEQSLACPWPTGWNSLPYNSLASQWTHTISWS